MIKIFIYNYVKDLFTLRRNDNNSFCVKERMYFAEKMKFWNNTNSIVFIVILFL